MREMNFHVQIKQVEKEYSQRNILGVRSSLRKMWFCLTLKNTSYVYIALMFHVVKIFSYAVCKFLRELAFVIPSIRLSY